jgi:hypothetical protein
MEIHRIGVKVFVAEPAAVSLEAFVPVFHGWIQQQNIDQHLLIDVHDYSHIRNGPGILLVGHEGNFSMDMDEGKPGLFYYRKQPLSGGLDAHFETVLKTLLHGCKLIETEPALKGIRFRTDEFLFVVNDRLNAPNEDATLLQFQPALTAVLKRLLGEANLQIAPVSGNPKERFAVRAATAQSADVTTLLERMSH